MWIDLFVVLHAIASICLKYRKNIVCVCVCVCVHVGGWGEGGRAGKVTHPHPYPHHLLRPMIRE